MFFYTEDLPEAVEVRHGVLAGAVVDDLPLPHENDVVEQLVRLTTRATGWDSEHPAASVLGPTTGKRSAPTDSRCSPLTKH